MIKVEQPKIKLPRTKEVEILRKLLTEKEHRKLKKQNRKYQENKKGE
jgi:hypothetical protein